MIPQDLGEQLQQLLQDPDSMDRLLSMAQSLGFSPPAQSPGTPQPPQPDEAMLRRAMALMQQLNDPRQEDLIRALRPYLSPARQQALDQAARLAKLSGLAGAAMGPGGLFGGL